MNSDEGGGSPTLGTDKKGCGGDSAHWWEA
jgi:hypothetical protein